MELELPPLYIRDKTGAIVQWRVFAEGDLVITEHGKLTGKKAENKTRCKPTNVGRANARDAVAQAKFEAQAAWEKKLKEGYNTDLEAARSALVLLPMLAHPFRQEKNGKIKERKLTFPAFAQRKYNGLRCLAFVHPDKTVTLMSRQGTVWDSDGLQHIRAAVAAIGHPGDIFDGELYVHGVALQTLNSWIKREQADTARLEYVLYDMPSSKGQKDGVWEDRWEELRGRFRAFGATAPSGVLIASIIDALTLADTRLVRDIAEIEEFQRFATMDEGYEGLIIRLGGRRYEFNDRSDGLLKFKTFQDCEFKVIDVLGREYQGETLIVDKFVCKNDLNDATFEVVPRGSMEQRATWWKTRETLLGQSLVVRFLERSTGLVPQGNPVGVAFRLPEDLPTEESSMYS
jgi:DNA ligase 1